MKRSSTSLSTENGNVNTKRIKYHDDNLVSKNQEYLQLVLAKITELQRQLSEEDYDNLDDDDDETSDLGDSESEDTDDDIMKEVLTKVFEDLPDSLNQKDTEFINDAQKSKKIRLDASTDQSMELHGFQVCRKIAVNFADEITCPPTIKTISDVMQDNCNLNRTEFEARKQMLRSFDLHLAAKERDYATRLRGE